MTDTTNTENDTSPRLRADAFQCPHCHVYATQKWLPEAPHGIKVIEDFFRNHDSAKCLHCKKLSFWRNGKIIYPSTPSMPAAVEDMPKGVKKIYEEARLVEPFSKRAAMILLRVSLEKLMLHLQMKGKTLDEKIKNLKHKGVMDTAINWLLAVKIMGNEAAHIGNINPNDKEIVENLNKVFTTINLVVTITITLKNMSDDLTKKLPKDGDQTTQKKNP